MLLEIYQQQILPRLDYLTLLANLKPRQTGENFSLTCPACGDRRAFIKRGYDTIKCNKENSCGKTDLLTYINGNNPPRGKDWVDLVRSLGHQVGVHIPEIERSPAAVEAAEKRHKENRTLEQVLQICQAKFENSGAQFYLQGRGINEPDEFGWFDRQALESVIDRNELKALGLHSTFWDSRLVIPIRDRYGVLRALAARDLSGESDRKFVKTAGYDISSVVLEGLDQAHKYRDDLWCGESTIAIFSFRENGMPQMSACGGAKQLKPGKFEKLYDWGVKRITLAFDLDKTGGEATDLVARKWLEATRRPEIYIVDPIYWDDCNDPDEYLRKYGADATKGIFATALNLNGFLAQRYTVDLDLSRAKDRATLADRATNYLSQLTDPKESQVAWEEFYKRGIAPLLPLDEDFLLDRVVGEQQARKEAKAKEEFNKVRAELAQITDIAEAAAKLASAAERLNATKSDRHLRPVQKLSERLAAHELYLEQMRGKEFLGLPQRTLPGLDEATEGLQALITVAAGPGVGKTILVEQLCVDLLKANPKTCCLFISLELFEEELLNRMKSRAVETPRSKLLKSDDANLHLKARSAIEDVCRRFCIIDRNVAPDITTQRILQEVANLKQETECDDIVVAFDYFNKFPIPADKLRELRSSEDKDDWRMEQMERIRNAIFPNPFIVIATVNKSEGLKAVSMNNVKGSSRIVYDADTVLLLNKIEDDDLVGQVAWDVSTEQWELYKEPSKPRYSKRKKKVDDETEQALQIIVDRKEEQQVDFVELTIPKVRGGTQSKLTLLNRHTLSDIRELK
ncbi:MAG: hypothetical protein K2W95_01010 [Candidatus Obscuribacterales bacterium]|nr:hypothetical protein [Candidatus Obscuribacterales bacterium]